MAGATDPEKQIIQAAVSLLVGPVLRLIQSDPHQWSSRPCATCRAVTAIVGEAFGCEVVARRAQGGGK